MKAPDIPHDDHARIKSLRALNILDTPPEESFDRLTRMAKRLFGVPIAIVSLVDENRQWFKSSIGVTTTETPRDISFCGHAILGDGPFVIPDTFADVRFSDNPLVLNDPFIRFYAGYPLKAPNGRTIGSFCIIDREPRDIGDDELEVLRDLAALVEREIAAVQMATLDELTGITNRRGFMALSRHSIRFCGRQKLAASLVYMDLDNLKPINDSFGHGEGDRVLRVFADLMASTFRDSDIYARLGGDEFVVFLSNASVAQAEAIVARLHTAVEKENQTGGRSYEISFSHGIVECDPDKNYTVDTLLADGDALMYGLKKSKKKL